MKKLLVLFIFILFSFQAYAERRLVPVEIYHVDENSFTRVGSTAYLLIPKPSCQQGGVPEIDPGTVVADNQRGTYGRPSPVFGYLETAETPSNWRIRFDDYIYRTHLTIKTYCSYPIQCIKQ